MNYRPYLIPIISLLALILFIYIFTKVVIYIIIASILALICRPIIKVLSKVKLGKFKLPEFIQSIIALFSVFGIVFLLFYFFVPILIYEIKFLSTLNFSQVFSDIISQFPSIKNVLLTFGTEKEITDTIRKQINSSLNFNNLSSMMSQVVSTAGTLVGGTLAVLFITFFLLKDNKMLYNSILLVTPTRFDEEIKTILKNTQQLLSKYFIGLAFDVLIVSLTVTGSMFTLGIKNAVLIGIFTGIMNIIPYVGPFISLLFALLLGVTGCIEYNQVQEIGNVITKIFFTLLIINLIDGIIIQPYIFSSSVKAHPLEIFLVILMAASLAGIWGMVVAIPTYTLLRIIAKEFLEKFKFFKKITESIPD